MYTTIIYLVLGLGIGAYAHGPHTGACPTVWAVDDFSVTDFAGLWYEIAKTPNAFETGGQCATAEYTVDGESLLVRNSHVIDGVQYYVEGTAELAPDANGNGELIVTYVFGGVPTSSPLNILLTDYTNYAIAYSCDYDATTNTHTDNIWIMSRTNAPDCAVLRAVNRYLRRNRRRIHISPHDLVETDFSTEACAFTSSIPLTGGAKK